MRKTRKTKVTYDAISSLDPIEAGELLSAGGSSTTIDWKNHALDPSDFYTGDPPPYVGDPPNTIITPNTIGSGILGENPSIVIGGPGSTTTTVDGVIITELEKRVSDLEQEVKELKKKIRKGGFRGKPKI